MSKAKIVDVKEITENRNIATVREGVATHYDVQNSEGKTVAAGFTSHERAEYYIAHEQDERTRFDGE